LWQGLLLASAVISGYAQKAIRGNATPGAFARHNTASWFAESRFEN